jgi:hypothetical protein
MDVDNESTDLASQPAPVSPDMAKTPSALTSSGWESELGDSSETNSFRDEDENDQAIIPLGSSVAKKEDKAIPSTQNMSSETVESDSREGTLDVKMQVRQYDG